MFVSDLGDMAAVLAGLRALCDELPRLEALIELHERRADAIPHRTQALKLNHSLARRLIEAHRAWIDDVEAAHIPRARLTPRPALSPRHAIRQTRPRAAPAILAATGGA